MPCGKQCPPPSTERCEQQATFAIRRAHSCMQACAIPTQHTGTGRAQRTPTLVSLPEPRPHPSAPRLARRARCRVALLLLTHRPVCPLRRSYLLGCQPCHPTSQRPLLSLQPRQLRCWAAPRWRGRAQAQLQAMVRLPHQPLCCPQGWVARLPPPHLGCQHDCFHHLRRRVVHHSVPHSVPRSQLHSAPRWVPVGAPKVVPLEGQVVAQEGAPSAGCAVAATAAGTTPRWEPRSALACHPACLQAASLLVPAVVRVVALAAVLWVGLAAVPAVERLEATPPRLPLRQLRRHRRWHLRLVARLRRGQESPSAQAAHAVSWAGWRLA